MNVLKKNYCSATKRIQAIGNTPNSCLEAVFDRRLFSHWNTGGQRPPLNENGQIRLRYENGYIQLPPALATTERFSKRFDERGGVVGWRLHNLRETVCAQGFRGHRADAGDEQAT